MKTAITFLLFWTMTFSYGQLFIDFEDFELSEESYLNGSDVDGVYQSNGFSFSNSYTEEYDSWTGWAISNTTDTETVSYANQYSAITGSGHESDSYAVSYLRSFITWGDASAKASGTYITNSAFTYHTLLEGDQFSKKFGGATGDDPDYFIVNFTAFNHGDAVSDTVSFYLADYRSDNNDEDYIVDEWTWVDLSVFDSVDSIQISYESSDVGQFGINTPTYSCFDDFEIEVITVSTIETNNDLIRLYPNPTTDFIDFDIQNRQGDYMISDISGRLVKKGRLSKQKIDIRSLDSGDYIFTLVSGGVRSSVKIVKL